jgi:hypothetical protein
MAGSVVSSTFGDKPKAERPSARPGSDSTTFFAFASAWEKFPASGSYPKQPIDPGYG